MKAIKYEDAIRQLEDIVEKLENKASPTVAQALP